MRLIDADALKHYATGGVTSVGLLTLAEIDNAPTIDAVPVVRCKDCIHRGEPIETDYGVDVAFSENSLCPFNCDDPWYSKRTDDEFYCAYGERRKDEQWR